MDFKNCGFLSPPPISKEDTENKKKRKIPKKRKSRLVDANLGGSTNYFNRTKNKEKLGIGKEKIDKVFSGRAKQVVAKHFYDVIREKKINKDYYLKFATRLSVLETPGPRNTHEKLKEQKKKFREECEMRENFRTCDEMNNFRRNLYPRILESIDKESEEAKHEGIKGFRKNIMDFSLKEFYGNRNGHFAYPPDFSYIANEGTLIQLIPTESVNEQGVKVYVLDNKYHWKKRNFCSFRVIQYYWGTTIVVEYRMCKDAKRLLVNYEVYTKILLDIPNQLENENPEHSNTNISMWKMTHEISELEYFEQRYISKKKGPFVACVGDRNTDYFYLVHLSLSNFVKMKELWEEKMESKIELTGDVPKYFDWDRKRNERKVTKSSSSGYFRTYPGNKKKGVEMLHELEDSSSSDEKEKVKVGQKRKYHFSDSDSSSEDESSSDSESDTKTRAPKRKKRKK